MNNQYNQDNQYNKQVLSILGCTGSIGVNTLDVISRHLDKFEIFALAGHTQIQKLAQQCLQFNPKFAVVADEQRAQELKNILNNQIRTQIRTEVLFGKQSLIDVAIAPEVTGVMAAIVGAAGLPSALAAAQHGKTIYLANKETLVISGNLFMETARKNQARVLPIDSEHNAIYQVLPPEYFNNNNFNNNFNNNNLEKFGIESIILTASGGPFLNTDLSVLPQITPAQAVKHPNWSMGQKISVDSATMMNKGLELIEAHWLFACPPERLEVVIHPQSVIHSMVRYIDGSVLAQMGNPDMRTPIAYCLGIDFHEKNHHLNNRLINNRLNSGVGKLDFGRLTSLTFQEPDLNRFPCLKLAYDVMKMGGVAPCVLNASNEIAVASFLNHEIQFTQIAQVVEKTLESYFSKHSNLDFNNHHNYHINHINLDELLLIDNESRELAQNIILKY